MENKKRRNLQSVVGIDELRLCVSSQRVFRNAHMKHTQLREPGLWNTKEEKELIMDQILHEDLDLCQRTHQIHVGENVRYDLKFYFLFGNTFTQFHRG